MTTQPIQTIGTYFFGMNYIHAVALRENQRRESAAASIAAATTEDELRRALTYEWLIRPELQCEIGAAEYAEARITAPEAEADLEVTAGLFVMAEVEA